MSITDIKFITFYGAIPIRRILRNNRPITSHWSIVRATRWNATYKLDYCNSLYYNLPQSQLKRLQAIQNSLARCITSSSRFQHITPGLKSLHWLKVEQRIQYKLISLTYSSLQHNSPLYLRRLLTIPTSHRSTRSTSVVTLFKPSVKLETGKRSFSFAAPFLWSTLPN